jgi:pimeloyl-ACP methyl ester carboxylesterase
MKKIFSLIMALVLCVGIGSFISRSNAIGITSPSARADENNPTARSVQYGDITIHTECYNYSPKAREAVVYLHGLGGNSKNAEFLYHESNSYMTISFDLLNHGNTGKMQLSNWDTLLESINVVMSSYGIKKAYLVGHSFGAEAAMMFTQKYPDRVKKVVLVDRAHFNSKELDQFNMTRSLFEILEYNPKSGLTFEEFSGYLDLTYNNNITNTYNLRKKVLLLGSDPKHYFGDPDGGMPSLDQLIAMFKLSPDQFGMPAEVAAMLPDVTQENLKDYSSFILQKMDDFASANRLFSVIKTPFKHTMVWDENSKDVVRTHILKFLKNKD